MLPSTLRERRHYAFQGQQVLFFLQGVKLYPKKTLVVPLAFFKAGAWVLLCVPSLQELYLSQI